MTVVKGDAARRLVARTRTRQAGRMSSVGPQPEPEASGAVESESPDEEQG